MNQSKKSWFYLWILHMLNKFGKKKKEIEDFKNNEIEKKEKEEKEKEKEKYIEEKEKRLNTGTFIKVPNNNVQNFDLTKVYPLYGYINIIDFYNLLFKLDELFIYLKDNKDKDVIMKLRYDFYVVVNDTPQERNASQSQYIIVNGIKDTSAKVNQFFKGKFSAFILGYNEEKLEEKAGGEFINK